MTVVSLYERLQLQPLGDRVNIVLVGRPSRRGRPRPAMLAESVDRGDRRELHRRVTAIASEHSIQWIDDPLGIVSRERGPCSYSFDGGRR